MQTLFWAKVIVEMETVFVLNTLTLDVNASKI